MRRKPIHRPTTRHSSHHSSLSLIAPRTEPSYTQAHQHQPNPSPHQIRNPAGAPNSPLRPLLVKHAMPTILAPNLIPPLQRHLRVALAAPVRRHGPLRARCAARKPLAAKSVLRAEGRDLVCFARHGLVVFLGSGGCGRLRWARRCVRVRRGWEGVRLRWLLKWILVCIYDFRYPGARDSVCLLSRSMKNEQL
jgi:hypothetical protein